MTAAPTDGELSALVAEHVAGWKWYSLLDDDGKAISCHLRLNDPETAAELANGWIRPGKCDYEDQIHGMPPYATSADAVIPLLCEKYRDGFKIEYSEEGGWVVEIHQQVDDCKFTVWLVDDESLPRAICLALLRAHGVTL